MTTAETTDAVARHLDGRARFRVHSMRGWDVAFYLLAAISASAVVAASTSPAGDPAGPGLLTLAALVVVYTVLGRRAARTADGRLIAAYLVLLLVAVVVLVRSSSAGGLILFLAFSQVWYFAETRLRGIAWSVAVTVGVLVATAVRADLGWSEIPPMLAEMGVALAFSVLLGLWVTHVAETGEVRAHLLEQLEAAQAEAGRSHHAAGVAAERERMAREIHDTLAQGFTSIVMLSQTIRSELARGDVDRAAERVDLVERTARTNLAEARALVAAFTPVDLDGSTLVEALERLARRVEAETGLSVTSDVGADLPPLGRDVEVVLLRAAQEALSNVRRHAAASAAHLAFARVDDVDGVELRVTDDGAGFAPGAVEGFGLRGMRERVRSVGGAVEVRSGEHGTEIRVTVPTGTTEGGPG